MSIFHLLMKSASRQEKEFLLSRLNAVDRTFYQDYFVDKKLPRSFHQTRSIFVHVPKCAGTSLNKALYPDTTLGHRSAGLYQTFFPEQYQHYFTFAFARNPWDRLVSAYSYLCKGGNPRHDAAWQTTLQRFASFDEFVKEWLCAENVVKQIHFAPQHQYICDNTGVVSLDFVGKLETISEDFAYITQKLGVDVQLQELNRSRKDDYRSYYSDASIERVLDVYKRDIQLFGYQFD